MRGHLAVGLAKNSMSCLLLDVVASVLLLFLHPVKNSNKTLAMDIIKIPNGIQAAGSNTSFITPIIYPSHTFQ